MNNKGQVWIETVIYTFIGISLIALVLGIVTPRINDYRDRAVIEQTIEVLNIIDGEVEEILSAPDNRRIVDFNMKRGQIFFDGVNDTIYFIIDDSKTIYSEPGVEIEVGRVKVLTEEGLKEHKITLTLDYEQNITFNGLDEVASFPSASIPYKFSIENAGFVNNNIQVDLTKI